MRPEKLEFDLKSTTTFKQAATRRIATNGECGMYSNYESLVIQYSILYSIDNGVSPDTIGGILRNGQLCWIADGATIQIFSMKNGNKLATCTFSNLQSPRYSIQI